MLYFSLLFDARSDALIPLRFRANRRIVAGWCCCFCLGCERNVSKENTVRGKVWCTERQNVFLYFFFRFLFSVSHLQICMCIIKLFQIEYLCHTHALQIYVKKWENLVAYTTNFRRYCLLCYPLGKLFCCYTNEFGSLLSTQQWFDALRNCSTFSISVCDRLIADDFPKMYNEERWIYKKTPPICH